MNEAKKTEAVKHTPGPWEVNVAPRGKDVPQVSVSGETAVCILSENGDEEANARLIAAAPDLLAALKDVCGAANNGQPYTPAEIEKLFVPIVAKAEGR